MDERRDEVAPVPRADDQSGQAPSAGSTSEGGLRRDAGDDVRGGRDGGGHVPISEAGADLRDSAVVRGTDPWNDTPIKARLHALLSRLALADTFGPDETRPAESWQFTTTALLAYAKTGVIHRSSFEVHRHYFPEMGKRRRAWAKRNRVTEPPPGHRFFVDAMRWLPRNSAEGPRLVQQKYGASADNVIGLGRAVFAGVLAAEDVNTVVMRGSQVASLTHVVREPRNFSSYLAVLTHLWLHNEDSGARPLPMSVLVKSEMGRAAARIGSLALIHEAVLMGEIDLVNSPPRAGTAVEAATALGRALLAPIPAVEPWWMDEKEKHTRAFRPVVYPLTSPAAVREEPAVALRNREVVTTLSARGLL